MIQTLTDTPEAVELACYLTLKEFSEDNVKYIELRSTPRSEWYIEAVLSGMVRANNDFDIIARYLPSTGVRRTLVKRISVFFYLLRRTLLQLIVVEARIT